MRFMVYLALVAITGSALADGPLSATLEAHKISVAADGSERQAPAQGAAPGDLIEYRATYRNSSSTVLRGVVATLPVPADCEYVAGTAARGAQASVDGKNFTSLPLMRRVRLADGREQMQQVPVSEYRFLRWTLGDIAANGASTVTARVRVAATPNSANL
jgi:uncharacterized repeat protein (TIGR01451 family)